MKALGHTFVVKEVLGNDKILAVQGAFLPEMVPYLAREIEFYEGQKLYSLEYDRIATGGYMVESVKLEFEERNRSKFESEAWLRFTEGTTPASTPMPDLRPYIAPSPKKVIVDVGCGWGRVAGQLYLEGYSVIGTDINEKEIEYAKEKAKTLIIPNRQNTLEYQVDDATKHINFSSESADGVVLNAVLTAIIPKEDRHGIIREIQRILKPGGILSIAEFGQTTTKEYPLDYRKHALVTDEYGTIVAFKDKTKNFKDLSDDDIRALKREEIEYFAHHYTEEELRDLLADFEILKFEKKEFKTRSGKPINGFEIIARKPESVSC
ncbi:MAG: class I SAM-dependent methyltransferase [Candidatus Cloacimonetes bacterium]|nr:class I SAM-dependent methyltransferase [Candidatus Cloacimonadota bacterium]